MKQFVITTQRQVHKFYCCHEKSVYGKIGSTHLRHALKFDSRGDAERFLTNRSNQHPFKLGIIEEVEI